MPTITPLIMGGGGVERPGVGDQSEPSLPGLSAYEVPANAGFDGTEVEWLDSLRGEDGLSA